MHLLQVCNVGNIVGGTAACAWTVARSLPEWRHSVAFLSDVTPETRQAFAGNRVERWPRVARDAVAATGADLVLLHNTHRNRCDQGLPVPSVMYLHSHIEPAAADVTVACSRWLAERMRLPDDAVLYQAVPRPPFVGQAFQPDPSVPNASARLPARGQAGKPDVRSLRESPTVGRLCTPQRHKWPAESVRLYESLAERFPQVDWEFVGCPIALQPDLRAACRGRAVFHPAGWTARSLLWRWDAMLYHNPPLVESFGRVCAESLRAGCIPIVDNLGGFREQIVPGCGFLCDDPAGFHAAVDAVQSPAARFTLSHRCRDHGDALFSLREFRERLPAVVRKVGVEHRARRRESTALANGSSAVIIRDDW